MVISLINLLLVVVSFLFTLLTIFQSRNRISIKSQINEGIICYSCKEEIIYGDDLTQWPPSTHKELCKKCRRDDILDDVLERKPFKLTNIFFLKNWNFIFFSVSSISLLFQIINIFIHNYLIGLFSGLLFCFINLLNYLNFRYNSKKKQTQSHQ